MIFFIYSQKMYIRNSLFLLLFTFVNPLFSLFISSILFFKEKQSFFHVFIVTFAIFIFISSREYGVSWGTYPIVGNDDIPSYISILSSPNNSFIDLLQPLWVAFKLLYNFIFTGYWLLLFSFLSL